MKAHPKITNQQIADLLNYLLQSTPQFKKLSDFKFTSVQVSSWPVYSRGTTEHWIEQELLRLGIISTPEIKKTGRKVKPPNELTRCMGELAKRAAAA